MMRASRWRPVCPECGYSIRALTGPRCPECGAAMPSDGRFFRRWATRRVAWDRSGPGGFSAAYLRTLAAVTTCPWRAARGLVIPDRWGCAARWAGVHLLLAAVAGMLLSHEQYFGRWIIEQVRPSVFRLAAMPLWEPAPADRVVIWMAESLVLWLCALAVLVTIGCGMSAVMPRRHRAAKWGGVKWSLYSAVIPFVVIALWYAYHFIHPPSASGPWPMTSAYHLPPPSVPFDLLASAYGVWWTLGIVANPYDRRDVLPGSLLFAAAYGVVWLALTRVLFPLGPLEACL